MPQSFSRVLTHLVFSTKDRQSCLDSAIRAELHPYLAVVLDNAGCPCLQVGGTDDHIHLLFGLSRTLSIAEVVETTKTSSSKWIKTRGRVYTDFHWQAGYGVFSVGHKDAGAAISYIRQQTEHHRTMTFQEEYRQFLIRHEVEFDERYVWD